ncbi:MAG TPA: SRPBCC family protein [Usitatibacter sp.]|nr:SRPBCC family protein [Usitatibacter sp.]
MHAVQRGVRSRLYGRGRYSPARERGVHHFHRLLCEFLAQDFAPTRCPGRRNLYNPAESNPTPPP